MIGRRLVALLQYLRTPPGAVSKEIRHSIQDEIEFHLQESLREHLESGMTHTTAQRATRERFGYVGRAVRGCCDVSLADQRLFHRLHLLFTTCLAIAMIAIVFRGDADRGTSDRQTSHRPTSHGQGSHGQGSYGQPPAPADNFAASSHAPAQPGTADSTTLQAVSQPGVELREAILTASDERATATGDIRGTVFDDQSEPIGSVHILAVVKTWPPNGYRQQAYMTTTDSRGQFTIEKVYPTGQKYEVQIAAIADGRLLESTYLSKDGAVLDPVTFRLESTASFAVRFMTADGQPVAGVEAFPHRRTDAEGDDHLVYFQGSDPIVQRSNAEGVVRLPYFQPGDSATVYVRFPDEDWQTRDLVIPSDQQVVLLQQDDQP